MDKKRLLVATLFVAAIIAFATLLYFFFFKRLLGPGPTVPANNSSFGNLPQPVNGNISTVSNGNSNTAQFPAGFRPVIDLSAPTDIARGGLTKVIDYGDRKITGFASGASGTRFYDPDTALFLKLENGQFTPLTDKKFFNVEDITWSRDLNKAVLEYPDGKNIVYDFESGKQVTLPEELKEFSFDATGTAIGAKWEGEDSEDNWLMVGDTTGANFRLIEPLGNNAADVSVDYSPDNRVVGLFRDAASATSQVVLPLGTQGENYKQFEVDGLNFESKWSPVGNVLLYSVANPDNGYRPQLYLTAGDTETLGSSQTDLTLATWPEKCSFNKTGSSIYCAESQNLPEGSGLYPELARGRGDAFYRIDLHTGQRVPLALPVGSQISYNAQSVHLSDDESMLYFVDGVTQELHSIRLK